jgi:hypothetical protein
MLSVNMLSAAFYLLLSYGDILLNVVILRVVVDHNQALFLCIMLSAAFYLLLC